MILLTTFLSIIKEKVISAKLTFKMLTWIWKFLLQIILLLIPCPETSQMIWEGKLTFCKRKTNDCIVLKIKFTQVRFIKQRAVCRFCKIVLIKGTDYNWKQLVRHNHEVFVYIIEFCVTPFALQHVSDTMVFKTWIHVSFYFGGKVVVDYVN